MRAMWRRLVRWWKDGLEDESEFLEAVAMFFRHERDVRRRLMTPFFLVWVFNLVLCIAYLIYMGLFGQRL